MTSTVIYNPTLDGSHPDEMLVKLVVAAFIVLLPPMLLNIFDQAKRTWFQGVYPKESIGGITESLGLEGGAFTSYLTVLIYYLIRIMSVFVLLYVAPTAVLTVHDATYYSVMLGLVIGGSGVHFLFLFGFMGHVPSTSPIETKSRIHYGVAGIGLALGFGLDVAIAIMFSVVAYGNVFLYITFSATALFNGLYLIHIRALSVRETRILIRQSEYTEQPEGGSYGGVTV